MFTIKKSELQVTLGTYKMSVQLFTKQTVNQKMANMTKSVLRINELKF